MQSLTPEIYKRIKQKIIKTDLIFNNQLSEETGVNIYLKSENTQISGSFKYRGVISKLSMLKDQMAAGGKIVVCSTGNHAAASALAAKDANLQLLVFVPETISEVKLNYLAQYDLEVRKEGRSSAETEVLAAKYAREKGLQFIHPYNDPYVIAGQGSIGLELLDQLPDIDYIFVPIGGGGLVSGIALYLKEMKSSIKVIGCQPENAPEMVESVSLGRIVKPSQKQTIADGTAGGLDPGTVTFNICKKYVNDYVLLSEDEIELAVYKVYKSCNQIIEPAGVLSVAAIFKTARTLKGQKVIAIISGGRIDTSLFDKIIKKYD